MSYLTDSIKELGVQVPLVVLKRGKRFMLLDGERRYYASKAAGLDEVPAYVQDQKLSENDILYRMFQIHHLREQWNPVQQCKALENLYQGITRSNEITEIKDVRAQVQAVVEEIASLTGIEPRTAYDRVKFLRFPKRVKDRLYHNLDEEGYWYICEIEEKIIIPALVNYPEYFARVDVDDVREHLFEKLQFSVKKSTEVRKVAGIFRRRLERPRDQKKVVGILNRLQKQKEMTYADAEQEFVRDFPELSKREPLTPRQLLSSLNSIETSVAEFDVGSISKATKRSKVSRDELVHTIESLIVTLEDLLEQLETTAAS